MYWDFYPKHLFSLCIFKPISQSRIQTLETWLHNSHCKSCRSIQLCFLFKIKLVAVCNACITLSILIHVPKSASFRCPALSSNMLSGFTSLSALENNNYKHWRKTVCSSFKPNKQKHVYWIKYKQWNQQQKILLTKKMFLVKLQQTSKIIECRILYKNINRIHCKTFKI